MASPTAAGSIPSASALGRRFGRAARRGPENSVAQAIHPGVIDRPRARWAVGEMVLIQDLGKQGPHFGIPVRHPWRLFLHAVANGLPQQRVRVFAADDVEQAPRPIRQYHAVNVERVFDGDEQRIECVGGRTTGHGREG